MKETILRLERKAEESARSAEDRDRKVMEAIRAVQKQHSSRVWWRRLFGK